MSTGKFATKAEAVEWDQLVECYHNLTRQERRLVTEHYDNLRDGKLYQVAAFKRALDIVTIGGPELQALDAAAEYKEIMRGEEIWASMSKNSES